jgi:hypothetical protein
MILPSPKILGSSSLTVTVALLEPESQSCGFRDPMETQHDLTRSHWMQYGPVQHESIAATISEVKIHPVLTKWAEAGFPQNGSVPVFNKGHVRYRVGTGVELRTQRQCSEFKGADQPAVLVGQVGAGHMARSSLGRSDGQFSRTGSGERAKGFKRDSQHARIETIMRCSANRHNDQNAGPGTV